MSQQIALFDDPPIGKSEEEGDLILFGVVVADTGLPQILCARQRDGKIVVLPHHKITIEILGDDADQEG